MLFFFSVLFIINFTLANFDLYFLYLRNSSKRLNVFFMIFDYRLCLKTKRCLTKKDLEVKLVYGESWFGSTLMLDTPIVVNIVSRLFGCQNQLCAYFFYQFIFFPPLLKGPECFLNYLFSAQNFIVLKNIHFETFTNFLVTPSKSGKGCFGDFWQILLSR